MALSLHPSQWKTCLRWARSVAHWNVAFPLRYAYIQRQYAKNRPKTTRSEPILGKYDGIFLIRINHSYAGLFAYFMFVLNQIRYAEKRRLMPVVYFGKQSGNGDNAYYEPEYGENVWEYYFEPVAEWSYAKLQSLLESPGSGITSADVYKLNFEYLTYLHMYDPKSIYGYPYGFYQYITEYDAAWFAQQREKARDLVDRYIRVKRSILDIVDAFHTRHLRGRPVVGVHMRGTDKGAAVGSDRTMAIIRPEAYFEQIDRFEERHPGCLVFVATDQTQYLEAMKARYSERATFRDVQRSNDRLNPFQKKEGSPYKKGEEALVDCLILSRCDFLLKCTSHLSETAMYFNRRLECTDMNYLIHEAEHVEKKPRLVS